MYKRQVLICDTAGRLHNKKNLMEELRKIYRIIEKEYPEAYLETLVVLDGTTGQNALAQACLLYTSVLELTSSEFLFYQYADLPEGKLTKKRASIVCEPTLALCAKEISLGDYLLLGKGEEATGGRNRNSIISDAMEALIGAIYLDGGFANAKEFIHKYILNDIENKQLFYDSKTTLQEIVQAEYEEDVQYVLVLSLIHILMQNHPHDSICSCNVDEVNDEVALRFVKSRQVAEQLCKESMEYLAEQVDTSNLSSENGKVLPFAVYNFTGWDKTDMVSVVLDVDRCFENIQEEAYWKMQNMELPVFVLKDSEGNVVEAKEMCIRDRHTYL